MLTDTSRNCRGNPKRLMDSREVMVHVKQRQRVCVVLDLFAECVRQARETAHVHPHVQVLSFYIAGTDVLRIGAAKNDLALDTQTLRGAVPLLGFRIIPEYLDKLRVVDLIREGINHRVQVHFVAVGSYVAVSLTLVLIA